jgi:hypothetical protein
MGWSVGITSVSCALEVPVVVFSAEGPPLIMGEGCDEKNEVTISS